MLKILSILGSTLFVAWAVIVQASDKAVIPTSIQVFDASGRTEVIAPPRRIEARQEPFLIPVSCTPLISEHVAFDENAFFSTFPVALRTRVESDLRRLRGSLSALTFAPYLSSADEEAIKTSLLLHAASSSETALCLADLDANPLFRDTEATRSPMLKQIEATLRGFAYASKIGDIPSLTPETPEEARYFEDTVRADDPRIISVAIGNDHAELLDTRPCTLLGTFRTSYIARISVTGASLAVSGPWWLALASDDLDVTRAALADIPRPTGGVPAFAAFVRAAATFLRIP